jgi:hypothetical protein
MRRNEVSFGIRLLGPKPADRDDVDCALTVFVRNTSPLLRTKTNQIRAKITSPETPEGRFYFAAFYRSDVVIGFAMFGYYPRGRLVVVDHMVIDGEHRGGAAFYVFAQLLQDAIYGLNIEVDFTAVELEKSLEFGGFQTGGMELVRLLGQVGFGQVHVDYILPNMEPKNYEARYEGILMLRGAERLYRIRREDLLEIVRTILFDHYLPWYRDFFEAKIENYRQHLERLYAEFDERLQSVPVIKINGPETDILMPQPANNPKSPEATAAIYLLMFAVTAAISTVALHFLQTPPYLTVPVLLALLAIFVGIAATSRGQALDVLEQIMTALPGRRNKSRYLQSNRKVKSAPKPDRRLQDTKTNSPDRSIDMPN